MTNTLVVVGAVSLLVALFVWGAIINDMTDAASKTPEDMEHVAEPVALVVETTDGDATTITREYTANGRTIRETRVAPLTAADFDTFEVNFVGTPFVPSGDAPKFFKGRNFWVNDDDGNWRGFDTEAEADYFRDVVLPRIRNAKRAGLPPKVYYPTMEGDGRPFYYDEKGFPVFLPDEPASEPPAKRDFPELDLDE